MGDRRKGSRQIRKTGGETTSYDELLVHRET